MFCFILYFISIGFFNLKKINYEPYTPRITGKAQMSKWLHGLWFLALTVPQLQEMELHLHHYYFCLYLPVILSSEFFTAFEKKMNSVLHIHIYVCINFGHIICSSQQCIHINLELYSSKWVKLHEPNLKKWTTFISTLNVLSFYTKKHYNAVQLAKHTSWYFTQDHTTCVQISLKWFQRSVMLQINHKPNLSA